MSIKKIVWAVLAAVMVVAFCGCDLWMNDWKGYLDYWSEAVLMGRVEVSGATFQTNADGVQTLPLDATANISGYVINPQGHTLLDRSIEINEPALANSATKNVADPTLISVLLQNVASQGITEHTTFTVTFAPVRADTNIASTETMSVTLQYNTPPAAPLRMNSDGTGGFEVVQAGGTWNADNAGNLYWKWPYTTNSDTEPNAVEWFSIDGVLYELSECEVPNNSGIYSKNIGNKSVKLAAVDSEGIVGPSIISGVTVPAGEAIVYQITFNDDGGSGSNTPLTVVYGQELPAVTPPSRTGYTFGGYFTAQDGGGIQYYDENGADVKSWDESNDTTLYAKWTANSYTITFDRAGGTGGSVSISVTYDGTPSPINPPLKAHYAFGGYYTAQNGGGDKYFNADGSYAKGTWNETSGKTLYAQWLLDVDDVCNEIATANGAKTITLIAEYYTQGDLEKIRDAIKDNSNAKITLDCRQITVKDNVFPKLFEGVGNLVGIKFPDTITEIAGYGFKGSGLAGTVAIPASVTTIGASAFMNSKITNVEFAPDSQLTTIEQNAFNECHSLTSIDIPATVTKIGPWAFYACSGMRTVTIRYTGKEYEANQQIFFGNTSLETVHYYPTAISTEMFSGCTSLKNFYVYSATPPKIYSSSFNNVTKSAVTVSVPSGTSSVYEGNTNWRDFNIVER